MGTFDWNNDGKTDWKDDALFHEVISKDDNSDGDDDSGFPTLTNGRGQSSGNTSRRAPSVPQHTSGSSELGCLVTAVAAVTLFLCISTLFMGYSSIIGDLLGFGVLAFIVVCFIAR